VMWLCTEAGVAHSGIGFAGFSGFAVIACVAEIVQRVGVAGSRW
jgi:hypothetical protein